MSLSIPRYLFREMKTCPHTDLHANIQTFIQNDQILQTIQMSINYSVDQQIVQYTYSTPKLKETKY